MTKRQEQRILSKLRRRFGSAIRADFSPERVLLTGESDSWDDIVSACSLCAERYSRRHVVNDIRFTGGEDAPMHSPSLKDDTLEGRHCDVLVIGGGITGCAILRELTRWRLDALLIEKESDVAMGASSRNDGQVHSGTDLSKGSLKQKYVILGNCAYDQICSELEVPFRRVGQYACFTSRFARPLAELFAWQRRTVCGTRGTRVIGRKELYEREPELAPGFAFAVYDWSAGSVCPYGLTIAYAENAIRNGAAVSLNTVCLGMELSDGRITAVHTNRGTVYPRLVINAAGVYAEEIARMAGDRFYSIHPRKGSVAILDKKKSGFVRGIASDYSLSGAQKNTKGGGIVHTAHGNLLVGPDAVETWEKENHATARESIRGLFERKKRVSAQLSERDIITWFTGVRAPTFEEDFILEKGRATENLIHAAGIQSPGLTAAPAFAPDMAKLAVELLGGAERNCDFDPHRSGYGGLAGLPPEEREKRIRENGDYGVIVCRCEEISRGEILDALRSPLCVPTVDGVKRRVRPGMGRCQGGFCQPLVSAVIAEFTGGSLLEVTKNGGESYLNCEVTK